MLSLFFFLRRILFFLLFFLSFLFLRLLDLFLSVFRQKIRSGIELKLLRPVLSELVENVAKSLLLTNPGHAWDAVDDGLSRVFEV